MGVCPCFLLSLLLARYQKKSREPGHEASVWLVRVCCETGECGVVWNLNFSPNTHPVYLTPSLELVSPHTSSLAR